MSETKRAVNSTMTARTYFRLSLLLPLTAPLVAAVFGVNGITAVIVMSLLFSGIPYLLFASGLYVLIGKLDGRRTLRLLSLAVPVLFVPVNALFWVVPLLLVSADAGSANGAWNTLTILSVYILVLGYAYIAIVNVGLSIFDRLGITARNEIPA